MIRNAWNIFPRQFSTANLKPKICIVGAGPAGFYAAQGLLKKLPTAEVDVYERLPVPFGLVRFGVAPDHPEVKNVINTFTKTAENPNFRFCGNVNLGSDVSIKQLREAYNIVLLTYGAEENRKLNIPGENLKNVIPARNIVGWYNGVPTDKDLEIDFNTSSATIFGQGNVAIDVARILLTPIDQLKVTDITHHALDQLASSKIKEVNLIGRRGPLQAAFTIKELREMLKLSNCRTAWKLEDFNGLEEIIPTLARPKRRIMELMLKSLTENSNAPNIFKPIFFKSPLEIIGTDKIESVKLGLNNMEGTDLFKQKAVLSDKTEMIECTLGITSIGYKSIQADVDIPFDNTEGIAKNNNFKISDGFYTSGWLATGPTGVILTTMNNAFTTADYIMQDIQKDDLLIINKRGFEEINDILKGKNIQIVKWKDWLKIDNFEQKAGHIVGKPREKVVEIKKMLEIAS